MSMLSIPLAGLSVDEVYLLLRDSVIPRPIAWVSTVDSSARSNLAPFSFFAVCSSDPPVIGFSVVGQPQDANTGQWPVKDTLSNIRSRREFVVNIAPESLHQQMVETSASRPPGDSEFAATKLVEVASAAVVPPRVEGVPVALECVLHGVMEIGRDSWVMGRVIHAHVDERVYLGERAGERHRIDLLRDPALRPVGRLGRALYARLDHVQTVMRPDGPNQ